MIKIKAYIACALGLSLFIGSVEPFAAGAAIEQVGYESAIQKATPSEADREEWEEEESIEDENSDSDDLATPSVAERKDANLMLKGSSSIGDIWDAWSGKTSFEFLNGSQGEGSEEKPYLIKNREQLMGLSELTAMGMVVQEGGGSYAGDYSNAYFALSANIDMQGVDWIPIGFYQDSSQSNGSVTNVFTGHFDGRGYTIKNLKLNTHSGYDYVGLFGVITDAEIKNLTLAPDSGYYVTGRNHVGTLIGAAEDSIIKDITIKNSYVSASGIAGGLAGSITGTSIENSVCENVKVDSQTGTETIYVGGIAGQATSSLIIDCTVTTGNSLTARIQGKGYVGGITGCQNDTDIFNTYVSGTIGGNGSTAIGGITGEYVAGKMKVARFEGEISNSYLGSNSREGSFIGTRRGAATNFNYVSDVAYLFADTQAKIAANICGSGISDDNDYTYDAKIGYTHGGDNYYTLVQGGNTKNITDQYYYEVLEEGILSIMDNEHLGEAKIDHFAPNATGKPVRGYLVVTEQIDTMANGQYYSDVAAITVQGSSQYCKPIDKDHRGALAYNDIAYLNTAPNNTETEKYEMDGVPFYKNATGTKKNTAYDSSSKSYTFKMPAEDIAVSASYKKVAVSIKVEPDIYNFTVTQTRAGNRKNPTRTTVVKNGEGKLIATYINGSLAQGTQVQPVTIKATIDTNNDVADNKVKWSVDDVDLITLDRNTDEDSDGYTGRSASITLNLGAQFFTGILTAVEKEQADSGYANKIPNTIYGAGHQNGGVAILTASTRPAASFEGKPCTDNSRINVTFQILDNTYVAAEGTALDKSALSYTITRTLTGDRTVPVEIIAVTPPQSLTATFTPDFFSKDEVAWTSSDTAIVTVSQDENAYKEASVSALKDAKWIKDIIATDHGIWSNDKYAKVNGSGTRSAVITVNAMDKLGNRQSTSCDITVNFVTEDHTIIHPEGIELDKYKLTYNLLYHNVGDINSETLSKSGFEIQGIRGTVIPDIEDTQGHKPYNRDIIWTSTEPDVVSVDRDGNVSVADHAAWIKEALLKPPYKASKTVDIIAATKDNGKTAVCKIDLTFDANCLEADRETETFDIVLTKTGRRSNPTLTYTGQEGKKFSAAAYNINPDLKGITWASDSPDVLTVGSDGVVTPVITADWIKNMVNTYPYTSTVIAKVIPSTLDGKSDPITVTLNFKVVDHTTSGGSGGGSGGGGSSGGGGGGASSAVTPGGTTKGNTAPAGAVTGTWVQDATGKWLFTGNGRTFTNEWAYIHNPFAIGMEAASWFRFDMDGHMLTGWYTDIDGNVYYLHNIPDGTQGRMYTGWNWVKGEDGKEMCYYFNAGEGTKGKLIKDAVTPDGYQVNAEGAWVVDGAVQKK